MSQTYALARQAGFGPAEAVIAAAIAAGESGLRPDAIGDRNLTDATWGPSVGLMQIRTLKRDTGTGRTRDISRLSDPLQNMIAAYEISNGGKNWSPWTVYNTGRYRSFLGQASTAASVTPVIPGANVVGVVNPLDKAGDRLTGLAVTATVALLGVALVVLGGLQVVK